jgi:hypothetical protein
LSVPETERWAQRVRDLPDLRWGKVMRARGAVGLKVYEADSMLDTVLAPLADEIGVLCRE